MLIEPVEWAPTGAVVFLLTVFHFKSMTFLSRILGALLFGLLVILNLPAQAQAWQWATKQRVASTGNHIEFASTYATAITASGEVYAGHRFNGSFTLGAQTYASSVNGGAALAH